MEAFFPEASQVSHWISQSCLWSMEMTDNNTNARQDATTLRQCPSCVAGANRRGPKREGRQKNTVLPGAQCVMASKEGEECRSVMKTTVVVRLTLPEAFGKQDDCLSKPARMKRTCKREPQPALAWAKGCCLWKPKKSCVNAMWKGLEQKGQPYSPQLHSPITVAVGRQGVLKLILPKFSACDLDKEFHYSHFIHRWTVSCELLYGITLKSKQYSNGKFINSHIK